MKIFLKYINSEVEWRRYIRTRNLKNMNLHKYRVLRDLEGKAVP